jgi:hypothetical protein
MRKWLDNSRDEFLGVLLWLDGRGVHVDSTSCTRCKLPSRPATFRCTDCHDAGLLCRECVLASHSTSPFHWVQVRMHRGHIVVLISSRNGRALSSAGRPSKLSDCVCNSVIPTAVPAPSHSPDPTTSSFSIGTVFTARTSTSVAAKPTETTIFASSFFAPDSTPQRRNGPRHAPLCCCWTTSTRSHCTRKRLRTTFTRRSSPLRTGRASHLRIGTKPSCEWQGSIDTCYCSSVVAAAIPQPERRVLRPANSLFAVPLALAPTLTFPPIGKTLRPLISELALPLLLLRR